MSRPRPGVLGRRAPRGHRTLARLAWIRFRRHRMALAGLCLVGVFALSAIFVHLASPYDPEHSDLDHRLAAPTWRHPMGTDDLGRDLLTRLLYGGRISLTIGVMAMALAVAVGTAGGAAPRYLRGWPGKPPVRGPHNVLFFPALFVPVPLGPGLP